MVCADANEVAWVVSSSIANNKLYVSSGSSISYGSSINAYLRRINVYDVF